MWKMCRMSAGKIFFSIRLCHITNEWVMLHSRPLYTKRCVWCYMLISRSANTVAVGSSQLANKIPTTPCFFFFRKDKSTLCRVMDVGKYSHFHQPCHNLTTQKHARCQKLFKANWREMSSKKKEKRKFSLCSVRRLGKQNQFTSRCWRVVFCILLCWVFCF